MPEAIPIPVNGHLPEAVSRSHSDSAAANRNYSTFFRATLVVALLCATVIGTLNLTMRRNLPVELGMAGRQVVITRVAPGSQAAGMGVRAGDIVVGIGTHPIRSLAHARWETHWLRPGQSVEFMLQRGAAMLSVSLRADERHPLGFLMLDRLTALVFLLTGLLVWWPGKRDTGVSAFLSVCVVTGVALMLGGGENGFHPRPVQDLYALACFAARAFIPAILTDFLFRFTARNRTPVLPPMGRAMLYLLGVTVFFLLTVTYLLARSTDEAEWVLRFHLLRRYAYGALLMLCAALSVGRLLFVCGRSADAAEKNRCRWLLICAAAGIAPYALAAMLPLLWNGSPLLPSAIALSPLAVIPLGWAVIVASVREPAVKRRIYGRMVQLATAGSLVWLAIVLSVLAAAWFERRDLRALIALIGLAVPVFLLAAIVLAGWARMAVERLHNRLEPDAAVPERLDPLPLSLDSQP